MRKMFTNLTDFACSAGILSTALLFGCSDSEPQASGVGGDAGTHQQGMGGASAGGSNNAQGGVTTVTKPQSEDSSKGGASVRGGSTVTAAITTSNGGTSAGGTSTGSSNGGSPAGGTSTGTMNMGGTAQGGSSGLGGASLGGGSSSGGTGGRVDCSGYTKDLSCTSDADCCLVGTQCNSSLWLVTSKQQAAFSSCLSAGVASSMCPACLAAPVQLSCQNQRCQGTVLDRAITGYSSAFSKPHCGKLPLPGTGGASSSSVSSPAIAYDISAGGTAGTSSTSASATVFNCSSGY